MRCRSGSVLRKMKLAYIFLQEERYWIKYIMSAVNIKKYQHEPLCKRKTSTELFGFLVPCSTLGIFDEVCRWGSIIEVPENLLRIPRA